MYSGGVVMKKRPQAGTGFFAALAINLIFSLEWTIPAWILLVLHFVWGFSLWWFFAALILWVVCVALKTIIFSWLIREGNRPDPPKENKNPYSASNRDIRR